MNSLISVIIPFYNSEKTILKSLDSVMCQSLPPFEVITINDNSTDNTVALIKEYYPTVIILNNIFKKGPAGARNTGIKAAKGTHIAFLDSDDVWLSNHLLLFNKNSNYQLWFSTDTLKKYTKVTLLKQLISNRVITPCAIIQNNNLYFFPEDMMYCEDYFFFTNIIYKGNYYFENSATVILGREPGTKGGLSSNLRKMRFGEIQTYYRICTQEFKLFLFLPILIIFSFLKHIRKIFKSINYTKNK